MGLDYLQALMGGAIEETPLTPYRDIWVVAETRRGALACVTRDTIGRARELADMLGVRVTAILIGSGVAPLASDAIACGSDSILLADDPILTPYRVETYVALLADVIAERKPEIVLLGATSLGRDLAPRLAARLKTGLLSECVALDINEAERLLIATRQTHNGTMLATAACPTARPQIATVRPGSLRACLADRTRTGVIEQIAAPADTAATTCVEAASAPPQHPQVTSARVIIMGGRGIGGADGFGVLEELAALLGAVVGATRSAVELGWAPRQHMIDSSGASVHPDLLIAVGTSGVFTERVATRGARVLVAINKDAHAPIMRRADYAIVGNWRDVVPELILAIKEAQQS
jgi:electron transfer flavoprotein alpha subunit